MGRGTRATDYDLLIKGGTVVDGSGGAPFPADVAIADGKVVAVGKVSGSAAEVIDAAGKLVTPGFVDIHTHYDGQITWEHRLSPSCDHGVTTVVMGNCGVGFAPTRPADREKVVALMEGVEDIPGVVMTEGVPWNWETFPEYLDAIEKRVSDVDFAAQLPHSPLRVYVMGDRGADREPPTDADLAEMRRLTAEAIRAGALGVTTSRHLGHRSIDGSVAPSINSEEDELKALAGGLRDAGKGVFQMITNATKPPEQEFSVIRQIAEVAGRPVSFSLVLAPNKERENDWKYFVKGMVEAKKDDIDIRGQISPRAVGVLFGLDLSTHPFCLNPSYEEVRDLPLDQKVARMRDPEFRKRILSEKPEGPNPDLLRLVQRVELLFPLGDPPNYTPDPADSIVKRAREKGIDPMEALYDELLKDDGHAILLCPIGNATAQGFDGAVDLFGQPSVVLGLGDGGAHYGRMCDASFPTFLLTRWTRDKIEDRGIDVQTAIKMLARDTAVAVGLNDRGLVRPGFKADLNIIDYDRLKLHAPRVRRDLPAGGRRLAQRADGYVATIVSGQVTYREGVATGALPGRLVRGQQEAVPQAA